MDPDRRPEKPQLNFVYVRHANPDARPDEREPRESYLQAARNQMTPLIDLNNPANRIRYDGRVDRSGSNGSNGHAPQVEANATTVEAQPLPTSTQVKAGA
ncbi:hypothetical protein A2714_00320 [Candidatus Woesebacteria bacterium RIFCSPHIGHO2_01_FULL_38_9]|uniref:Uncharacterized protein n=2 Tax=Candidatus Woeseibacteriota TaxID=1752722 RepID=A0A1F7Y151_9BACT|nr:MAG: hypothetical protein A2714_00320 [Candidatus Woesebacteria bacterium RIFCSPHIGHO2_01_FULL_38_9]OGM60191.1 MAG: hypothetical protein A3A75_05835 [Candidatus Woesebacteria bacterium RIFCSPLOWO2_01_FULL_39_10]